MLKTNRYDLPLGIENKPADWQKVVSVVDYELTQARAKFKKEANDQVTALTVFDLDLHLPDTDECCQAHKKEGRARTTKCRETQYLRPHKEFDSSFTALNVS